MVDSTTPRARVPAGYRRRIVVLGLANTAGIGVALRPRPA
jgi:hypothetical protein